MFRLALGACVAFGCAVAAAAEVPAPRMTPVSFASETPVAGEQGPAAAPRACPTPRLRRAARSPARAHATPIRRARPAARCKSAACRAHARAKRHRAGAHCPPPSVAGRGAGPAVAAAAAPAPVSADPRDAALTEESAPVETTASAGTSGGGAIAVGSPSPSAGTFAGAAFRPADAVESTFAATAGPAPSYGDRGRPDPIRISADAPVAEFVPASFGLGQRDPVADAPDLLVIPDSGGGFAIGSGAGSIPPAPEPGEWAMMLAGLSVVGYIASRRRPR